MVDLKSKKPCTGLVPVRVGPLSLVEDAPGHMTALAPYLGQDAALSEALKAAHGMAAPGVGRMSGKRGARALWFGQRMILLMGPAPDAGLAEFAALSDQSDGWAVLHLEGQGAGDVLARMTPLDLRLTQFKRGHTARSECAHMAASITRLGDDAFQIMVFRSMAATLVHEVKTAMGWVVALQ